MGILSFIEGKLVDVLELLSRMNQRTPSDETSLPLHLEIAEPDSRVAPACEWGPFLSKFRNGELKETNS
jgi:hypothetical protein